MLWHQLSTSNPGIIGEKCGCNYFSSCLGRWIALSYRSCSYSRIWHSVAAGFFQVCSFFAELYSTESNLKPRLLIYVFPEHQLSLYVWPITMHSLAALHFDWLQPPPDFGRSVSPISTRGVDCAHYINTCTPSGFFSPSYGPELEKTVLWCSRKTKMV